MLMRKVSRGYEEINYRTTTKAEILFPCEIRSLCSIEIYCQKYAEIGILTSFSKFQMTIFLSSRCC